MFSNKKRWQRTALAVAAASAFGLWGTSASALSLGRISVLSALGEPLRAEIEILDITEEEASSLRPRVATPDTFRANGLEYGAYMNGLGITLQRRGNGQRYLRLENSRAINDPFVDLVLEASWSSGRIVRDYTLLLDPPNLNNNQAAAPQAAQVNAVPVRIEPAPEAVAPAPAADSAAPANEAASAPAEAAAAVAPTSETAAPAPAEAAAPAPTAAPTPEPAVAEEKAPTPPPAVTKAPEAVPVPAPAMRSSVTVKAGDTATKLALAQKTTEVSLDQMLVAMLRANPQAFVNGNVNRLRKGSVVDMPTTLDAQATSTPEARQILQTQSKDFNEYRRRLAEEVPGNTANAADRKSSGNVQTQVEEKKPATTTPDKLTLSKGSVQTPAPEDKALKERQAKALAEREAELAKNVAELDKLDKLNKAAKPAAAPAPAPVPATPAPAPTATVQAPVATPAPAPAPEAPAPAAETAPAPAAPKPAAAPAPAPVEEPSLVDELLENPLVPAAGGGVVALLAGLMFFRSRQRKKSSSVDSSYLESRLQPDSFFGNSGGQQVDTNDAAGASSMVYSPSQLDAGDDVDPVAEADVYLAYGRDMQAEEILKEALRNHPGRLAVHQKLLEIYAKRRDAKSFAAVAKEAHKLSQGNGPEWEHICELGRELDPNNEFYHGGKPPASAPAPLQANNAPATPAYTPSPAPAPAAARAAPAAAAPNVDLDLDLDFSLDEAPSGGSASASLEAASSNTAPAPVAQATPAAPARDNLMNFDLGGLSLDLDTGGHSIEPTGSEDPLATKLALAQEFQSIGDTDGARALIEEILAEASGDMKARAESALAALS